MARRSRSKSGNKSNAAVYIIIVAAVLVALVVGFIMIRKNADPFPGIKEINRSELMQSGTSMAENVYRVSGKITEKRLLQNDRGTLIYISQDEGIENAGIVPIHVPNGIATINLEKGLSYVVKVKVNDEGLPIASEVKAQ